MMAVESRELAAAVQGQAEHVKKNNDAWKANVARVSMRAWTCVTFCCSSDGRRLRTSA